MWRVRVQMGLHRHLRHLRRVVLATQLLALLEQELAHRPRLRVGSCQVQLQPSLFLPAEFPSTSAPLCDAAADQHISAA